MAESDTLHEGKDTDAESVYFDAEESVASENPTQKSRMRTTKKAVRRLARKQADAVSKVVGFEAADETNGLSGEQGLRVKGVWEKEFHRDEKTGSIEKTDTALWGLAKYRRYNVKDGNGNELRGKTENLGVYRKSVDYVDDAKKITRGQRNGFSAIQYTKNPDGSRTFNGIKWGPISYERQKGKDGSTSSKLSFGEKYSFEKGTSKDGSSYSKLKLSKLYSKGQVHNAKGELVSSSRNIAGQIASEKLFGEDGNTKTYRKFTKYRETTEIRDAKNEVTFSKKERFGKSTIDRLEPDGTRLQYSTRGVRIDGSELAGSKDQIAKDIAAKKVRHMKHIDADGKVINEYKRSPFGIKSNEFSRGDEIAPDVKKSKGLMTRRENYSVSQAGQDAAARAIHPGQGSRMPGDWAGVHAAENVASVQARKAGLPETKLKQQLNARIRGLEERSRSPVLGR